MRELMRAHCESHMQSLCNGTERYGTERQSTKTLRDHLQFLIRRPLWKAQIEVSA